MLREEFRRNGSPSESLCWCIQKDPRLRRSILSLSTPVPNLDTVTSRLLPIKFPLWDNLKRIVCARNKLTARYQMLQPHNKIVYWNCSLSQRGKWKGDRRGNYMRYLETPSMIVGLIGYIETPHGLRALATVWAEHLSATNVLEELVQQQEEGIFKSFEKIVARAQLRASRKTLISRLSCYYRAITIFFYFSNGCGSIY